jgi:quercetin dioxygenase-like cupin family protein
MVATKLNDFIKGWFVGNFEPSLIKTTDVEVGIKSYKKDDYEDIHYHKIATELTAVVEGSVKMNGVVYTKGDIITILPNESTDFLALEDSMCVVVKYPGVNNDKYLGDIND